VTALPAPSPRPLEPPDDSYVGYRWPGAASVVRLPSGEYAVLSRDGDRESQLAQRVLLDRLHRRPGTSLLDAFLRDWLNPALRGEFVWPVEAIDKWLDAVIAAGHGSRQPNGPSARANRRRTHAPLARRRRERPTTPGAL